MILYGLFLFIILPYLVDLESSYVRVIEDRPYCPKKV